MSSNHHAGDFVHRAHRWDRRSAFTLVELLVVISIIALLISILLPSLSKAREAARQVKCMSILNQFGQAETFYANEYDGWVIPASGHLSNRGHVMYFQQPIFRRTLGMPEGFGARCAERGQICPNADWTLHERGPNNRDLYDIRWTYGNNDTLAGSWGSRHQGVLAYHKGDMRRPQRAMSFMDAMEHHISRWPASKRDYERYGEVSLPQIGWGQVNTAWRHHYQNGHGELNAVFYDGHAAAVKDTDLTGPGSKALWEPIDRNDRVDVFPAR